MVSMLIPDLKPRCFLHDTLHTTNEWSALVHFVFGRRFYDNEKLMLALTIVRLAQ